MTTRAQAFAFRAAFAALAFGGLAQEAAATSLSGAYLAGRSAAARNDYDEAARFFSAALARDPGDADLRDRAMTFKLLTGDLRGAAAIAGRIAETDPSHQLSALTLVADDIASGDFDGAVARLSVEDGRMSPLVTGLLRGWAEVGRGDRDAMEAAFAALRGERAAELFGSYHLGLARAVMGDAAGSREALEAAFAAGAANAGRPALALGWALETLGETDAARQVYADAAPGFVEAADELARLDRGEAPAPMVSTAREGAAEALFSIATALGSDRGAGVALLYARIALSLRPDLHEVRVLAGRLLDAQGQHEAAIEDFRMVPRGAAVFLTAELSRADALLTLDRDDDAVIVLDALARAHPEDLEVRLSLAQALSKAERWPEAIAAYDAALERIEPIRRQHWSIFYRRGIANERAGRWAAAEPDFQKALELEPDQPMVLNYLGYSWVELSRNFDEAQAMIEKAVEQKPEDGYITDSLGWVLYRVGKYAEATPHLERAVELMPTDPIINDHLGDALWMVGRKREARFQWRRAISFEPAEKDLERIRAKLDRGLDVVLKEEASASPAGASASGADPKAPAANGG